MFTLATVTAGISIMSYLIGSVNFAIVVSHMLAKEDVRNHGSGNAGMTNMLRTYGKGPAVITAFGDFFKAVAAIFLSRWIFSRFGIEFIDAGYIAGLFVLLGHVYPLYFGFRGGKGVMTTLGIILAVNPLVFLILAVIFVPLVIITRIVSLGSVIGAICYPVVTFITACFQHKPALFNTACACVYMAIILIMHRANIKRLLSGTEHKFSSKK